MQIKKILIAGVLIPFLGGCGIDESDYRSDVPVTPESSFSEKSSDSSDLPEAINLDIPFFSQAPTGNWGMPYQEACEEASLLLAYYYVTDQAKAGAEWVSRGQNPSMAAFEADELAMVDWEVETFGQYEHTTVVQTAQIARDYLGLEEDRYLIVDDPSVEDLKSYLAQGYPIVAPMAGRYLGNPYFTGEGPVYHMLVVRGYDENSGVFITNDVGTRHGENFIYTYDVFMNALHDWNDAAATNPEGILKGESRVLVLMPDMSP